METFLQEEIRNDYLVSAEMKKVWAIQLGLLADFIEVCEAHGYRYWAFAGTLLGAVRHQGYIPWDDDMDVVMPREDYEDLLKHPEYFKEPSQLHFSNNEENFYEGWARVHNVNTAVVYPTERGAVSMQGIYIDIFPLDDMDDSKRNALDAKIIRVVNVLGHACSYNINPNKLLRFLSWTNRHLHFFKPERAFRRLNRFCVKKVKNATKWGARLAPVYHYTKCTYDKKDYEETLKVPFEYMSINIPAGYDNVLRTTYGDYMKFPPAEKRGAWHSFQFVTDKSFRELNANNKK